MNRVQYLVLQLLFHHYQSKFLPAPSICPCQQNVDSYDFTKLDDLASIGVIVLESNVCYTKSMRNVVSFTKNQIQILPTSEYLNGTSYLIDDNMGLGHNINDLRLLEVMLLENVTQIVFTKFNAKPWNEWVKYFFYAIFKASSQRIHPIIYIYNQSTNSFISVPTINEHQTISKKSISLYNGSIICFERLIVRPPTGCCATCLSKKASTLYRDTVYSLFSSNSQSHPNNLLHNSKSTKYVTFVTRGTRYRHISNLKDIIPIFHRIFQNENLNIIFSIFDSSNTNNTFQHQIEICRTSDVIITPHGAFLANIIHMRNTSLVMEITCPFRSTVMGQAWVIFSHVASDFGVEYMRLYSPFFRSQNIPKFELPKQEAERGALQATMFLANSSAFQRSKYTYKVSLI